MYHRFDPETGSLLSNSGNLTRYFSAGFVSGSVTTSLSKIGVTGYFFARTKASILPLHPLKTSFPGLPSFDQFINSKLMCVCLI